MSTEKELLTELKTDMKYIRTDIEEIKHNFINLNGTVKEVKEWKIAHEQYFKIWSRIVSMLGVPIVLYLVYKFINFVL